MVPPPITMMSKLLPDGGGVTFWRGSRWDAGLVAMVPRSHLHVIGMNALERGSLEILREHRFRGAQRALHPALVERIGLAADEDSVVAGHRHWIEHAVVGVPWLPTHRPCVIAGAERVGSPILEHGGHRLRDRHPVHHLELVESHVDHFRGRRDDRRAPAASRYQWF